MANGAIAGEAVILHSPFWLDKYFGETRRNGQCPRRVP
jgi:hypothetical protein